MNSINNHQIHILGNINSSNIFIQPIDEHDFSLLESETNYLKELNGDDFLLVAFMVNDWNEELTPWKHEPVFGKQGFGEGAKNTLSFILKELIPEIEKVCKSPVKSYYLVGYSLAGLFALWCAYQTDLFMGIAACSPSTWYKGWIEYAQSHQIKTTKVYLSLGDKEEHTKNPIMATVGNNIKKQYQLLIDNNIKTTLEYNQGNHFVDSDKRTAKGMSWLLNK